MEGATYALRNGFDALQAAGLGCSSIRLTGGGSRSAAWRQMVADVFDLPVDVPVQPEGAAFGAALQALWASATRGSQAELVELVRDHVRMEPGLTARPDALAGAAYREAYGHFLRSLDIEVARGTPLCFSLNNEQEPTPMSTPFIGSASTSPVSAASRSRAPVPTIRWPSRSTTRTRRSAARPWTSTCASRSATGTRSRNAGHDPFGPGTRHFPWEAGSPMATAEAQRRCRLRVLHQARRAVLLLPRHRPGAGRRGHRPVREEPAGTWWRWRKSASRPPA